MVSAGVDALDQEKFSQCNFMNLYLENVCEVGVHVSIFVLVLNSNLSIIIELAREHEMILRLDFEVVYRA